MKALKPIVWATIVAETVLSAFAGPLDRAWIKGVTDRSPLDYRANEEMVFTLTPMDVDWATVPDGAYTLRWKRSGDDGRTEEGKIPLSKSPFVYRTKLAIPGFVRLEAYVLDRDGREVRKPWLGGRTTPEGRKAANMFELYQNKVFFDGGAGVGIDTLRAKDEPADFDDFWKRQYARLDLVPIKADLIEVKRADAKARLYAVRIDCAGLRPVTGYLEVPRDVDAGKTYPCVLETHGYSADRFRHDAPEKVRSDRIYLNINGHGQKLKEFGATEADRKALRAEVQTRGIPYGFDPKLNKDPETAYFNGMVLRVKRALQYLKTVKGWNGRDLLAIGGSQGGLQSIWAAGCGEGVTRTEAAIVWCCDLWRNAQRKGWYVPWTDSMGYYDPVNFAKRIPAATCRTEIPRAGLGDYVCPPTGLAKLWNAIPGANKRIVWTQGSEHGYVPPYYEGRDVVREATASGTIVRAGLRVGAINWGCSVPASTFFGGFATRALGPAKYRSRTPYYARVLGSDKIDFPVRSLAEYEREMRYAIDAGVDYFAYCWYDPESERLPCANAVVASANQHIGELTRARQLHLQSPLRDQLGLCAVLVTCHPYSDAALCELADTMNLACYEKVDGRPLVACFLGDWRQTVERLKGFCRARGTPEPFVVLLNDPGRLRSEEAEGVDAISAYSSNAPCSTAEELFDSVIDRNTTRTQTGRPVIPFFTTGWNPWPRIDNPVPWTSYARRPYPPSPTGDELMAGARRLGRWMAENSRVCVPGQMLVFAWNEFEEGGWICPTKDAAGDVDLTRCRDFRRVVDFLKGAAAPFQD